MTFKVKNSESSLIVMQYFHADKINMRGRKRTGEGCCRRKMPGQSCISLNYVNNKYVVNMQPSTDAKKKERKKDTF